MTITVWRSNRTEVLAETLANELQERPPAPFVKPIVVVHGRGVATWLEQFLAERLGVCAQLEFLFPGRFVARLLGAEAAADGASPPRLQQREQWFWTALRVLDALAEADAHAPDLGPLRAYLDHAQDVDAGARRCGLAKRIASAFDQYAIFRPEWAADWDTGGFLGPGGKDLASGQRWQAALWRKVVGGDAADQHVGALVRRFEQWRKTDAEGFAGGLRRVCPDRVFLFGLTSLPPSYLRVMALAAEAVPTAALLMSPSNQFWTDAPRRRKGKRKQVPDVDLESNPLIGAFGLLGAEFAELWEELVGEGAESDEFVAPEANTVLGTVQSDVLHLHSVAREGEPPVQGSLFPGDPSPDGRVARVPLPENDKSLSIHSCHGPTREVEVLRDLLLDCIDRGVAPHEIVVLLPDVEEYAPRIEAVFRGGAEGARGIPYRIADRPLDRLDEVADVLLRLLALVGARVAAADLVDLLGCAPVGQAFGIEGSQVDDARQLLQRSGMRWAFDAADRQRHGQPPNREHTLEFGLDRLLMGYAVPSAVDDLVAGVLPDRDVEGQVAALVGRLARFARTVEEGLTRLRAPRVLAEWRDDLLGVLDGLCARPGAESGAATEAVRGVLDGLVRDAEGAGYDNPLALDAVRSVLADALEASGSERGFLDGGVTFCAMLPLRSVPFRVVAMCGLSDGVFPRASTGLDVDLLAADVRPGDRDRRKDDRYLFLEAVLAARDTLLITYSGRNVRNDRELPPSVVLQELIDAVVDRFDPPSSAADHSKKEVDRRARVLAQILVKHPLQAFSPAYFDPENKALWSYDAGACAGARGLVKPKLAVDRRLFAEPMVEPERAEGERVTVELRDLQRFWKHPTEALLQHRFGLSWPRDEAELPRREPVECDPLAKSQVGQQWLDWAIADGLGRDQRARLEATGWLPPGRLADQVLEPIGGKVRSLVGAVKEHRDAEAMVEAAPFAIEVGERYRLVGSLPAARVVDGSPTWLVPRYVGTRGKHVIGPWIQHLVASIRTEGMGVTVFAGRDATVRFTAVTESRAWNLLDDLLGLYEQGRERPLRFEASSCLKRVEAGGNSSKAQHAYRTEREYSRVFSLVFGEDEPPFDDTPGCVSLEFGDLAERVFPVEFLAAWDAREQRS